MPASASLLLNPWTVSQSLTSAPLQRPLITLTPSHNHTGARVLLWTEALLLLRGWDGIKLCASPAFYHCLRLINTKFNFMLITPSPCYTYSTNAQNAVKAAFFQKLLWRYSLHNSPSWHSHSYFHCCSQTQILQASCTNRKQVTLP